MKISIQELIAMYAYIEEGLLNFSDGEVDLHADHYWFISSKEREDVLADHTLCVGSLVNDWQELKKMSQRKVATLADINRFANVLISVGEGILRQGIYKRKK